MQEDAVWRRDQSSLRQNVKDRRVAAPLRKNYNIFVWERNYFLALARQQWQIRRMKTKTEYAAQNELAGSTGRARTGKIAKLPSAIREELNSRLAEGEATEGILEWINGLPEVRAHLMAHHQGTPITELNLSRWRQGGFAGWAENVKMQDSLDAMELACSEMDESARNQLVSRIGLVLLSRLVSQLQSFDSMPEGMEKAKCWSELIWSYVALRRVDITFEEFMLARKKATHSALLMQLDDEFKQSLAHRHPGSETKID